MVATNQDGRVARRQQRNLKALLDAGEDVMSKKGIDAATMQEIADQADLGAGTVYSYFKSKDELAIAVLEQVMERLARRIETATKDYSDPAHVYAVGIRTVLETATGDLRWRQLLHRSEVIADALYRVMGPYAIRDLEKAVSSSRFFINDASLVWRMTSHTIIGVALATTRGQLTLDAVRPTVVRLLCMTGIGVEEARQIAAQTEQEEV